MKYKQALGKRKYYKRCDNHYAWRFAPTGALQKAEIFTDSSTTYPYLTIERLEQIKRALCEICPPRMFLDLYQGNWMTVTSPSPFINLSTK